MNTRLLLFAVFSVAASPLVHAQASTWTPDKAHSEVDFSVLHLGLSNVHGRFGNIGGSVVFDEGDVSKSKVNVTIDVTSIDTGVPQRDGDLKGANFFDVAQFPTATFLSTSVAKNSNGLVISGNLTLHGVTKPVTLQVEGPTGPVQGMDHKPHSGFSATTTLKRTDFDIATKFPTAVVGDEVKLTIDLDLAKQ
jgi:polyisoprenoid-binding protein YceI